MTRLLFIVPFLLLLAACGTTLEEPAAPTAAAWTETPTATVTHTPSPTVTPLLSPTPQGGGYLVIRQGQTFYSIDVGTDDREVVPQPLEAGFLDTPDRLIQAGKYYAAAMLSPDGTQLAYMTSDLDQPSTRPIGDLIVVHGDSETPVAQNVISFDWSPDSTQIAFVAEETQYHASLHIINADATGLRTLWEGRETVIIRTPIEWSPDGSRILYSEAHSDSLQDASIYVTAVDSGASTRLTDSVPAFWPTWSPDGTRIAFIYDQNSCCSGVYVLNADGTNQTLVADSTGELVAEKPLWSPDGTRIMFQTNGYGGPGVPPIGYVYVVALDGGGLTQFNRRLTLIWNQLWSPDGTMIAVEHGPVGLLSDVYVGRVDGSSLMRIATSGRLVAWRP